jgi:hypothetical protein
MNKMMHGGQIVSGVKNRMHVTNHFRSKLWTVEVRGHAATICPMDNDRTWVYYRNCWFKVKIDELVTFHDDTQGDLDKLFNDSMREAIEKYIDENHITFGDDLS